MKWMTFAEDALRRAYDSAAIAKEHEGMDCAWSRAMSIAEDIVKFLEANCKESELKTIRDIQAFWLPDLRRKEK